MAIMTVWKAVSNVSIGFWIMIIQVFLWINATWIYGPFADQVRNILQIYFILFLVVYVSAGLKLPTLRTGNKSNESLRNFLFMFVAGMIIMQILHPFLSSAQLAVGQFASVEVEAAAVAFGFMFLHGFVKAYIEEAVFRYAIPTLIGLKGKLEVYGAVISSVLFGAFHISVAMMSGTAPAWWTIIYLSALGMVFYAIYKRFGISGSTGFHFAYNLGVLGLLPMFIGGA